MDTTITTAVVITAPIDAVWRAFTTAGEIKRWSTVSDDARTTECTVDLREGGHFHLRRETQDGSGSNVEGTFTLVVPQNRLELSYGGRTASAQFDPWAENVTVTVVFNAESEETIPDEQQLALTIMQNFAGYVQGGM
ncbi:SRPBCC domain-containing protein [Duganella sp. LX20W]|uniref:SRPBCC domain-containing protein n=1 Tax=Rugamonas brunnea TaxID=2758569 RepID=A0A7W2EW29_9BURK|nr:SRPBCC domain-containing protein [Rugamonas brunnea]MBA5639677.1 SRPBCC domain-containing protein [Rugamonas brunnea]